MISHVIQRHDTFCCYWALSRPKRHLRMPGASEHLRRWPGFPAVPDSIVGKAWKSRWYPRLSPYIFPYIFPMICFIEWAKMIFGGPKIWGQVCPLCPWLDLFVAANWDLANVTLMKSSWNHPGSGAIRGDYPWDSNLYGRVFWGSRDVIFRTKKRHAFSGVFPQSWSSSCVWSGQDDDFLEDHPTDQFAIEHDPIEIDDLPIKTGDFPYLC